MIPKIKNERYELDQVAAILVPNREPKREIQAHPKREFQTHFRPNSLKP
jgi:hypothetical protein